MIDFNHIEKGIQALQHNRAVSYEEKTGKIDAAGFLTKLWRFFRPSSAKASDKKIAKAVSTCLKDAFEANHVADQRLVKLAEAFYHSKKIQKNAPEEAAKVERWLVGVKRSVLKDNTCSYQYQANLNLFSCDPLKADPRLLGTPRKFAEENPDYVDFLLKNELFYQMGRCCPKQTIALIDNEPQLPFANHVPTSTTFDEKDMQQFTRSWKETKEYLRANQILKEEDYSLLKHHMTKWGLVELHNYEWEKMLPITKVEPPPHPCLQVASYIPQKNLVPIGFEEQGHTGMVFVDSKGYVYSCGFFTHPDTNFFIALKAQKSILRSPDLYEARVDTSWQNLIQKKAPKPQHALPVRYNDGILQFDLMDDSEDNPCIEQLLKTWKNQKAHVADIQQKEAVLAKKRALKKVLGKDTKINQIQKLAHQLHTEMSQAGIQIPLMTADEKYMSLIKKVHDLQAKTLEANKKDKVDYTNGALPFLPAEQNCTHVSRYVFGQYAEVILGGRKAKDILNTRPAQNGQFLPPVNKSPISAFKWANIAIQNTLMTRIVRFASLLPILGSKLLGRGKATGNIKPRTSWLNCLPKVFSSVVSPQQVREEGMSVQFKIHSLVRKILNKIYRPTGLVPIYKN